MNSKSSIKKEFDAFASKIARLESLRQQLDALDVHGFEREADVIRGQLNDVNSISAVEKALVILRNNIRHKGGHHESAASHSKLTAQTRELKQELRQDTGSLKKRITELEARINKKKEISNKKQLSKDEVDFVKDVPHLERELHSLHKAFQEHTKLNHVHVDPGVGRMVSTNFDEFISNIKAELTERLKDKELSIDAQLAADLRNRENLFAKKYQHLVHEFHERYKHKVTSELAHEVRKQFSYKLHKKLDEERKRIVDKLVQDNVKRLASQRVLLMQELEREYRTKESNLKKQLTREKIVAQQELSQRRSLLNKRVKAFAARENAVKKKSDTLNALMTEQRTRFERKQKSLEAAHARLESNLARKEKMLLKTVALEKQSGQQHLSALKKRLEKEARDIKARKHMLMTAHEKEKKALDRLRLEKEKVDHQKVEMLRDKEKMHKDLELLKKHEKELLSNSEKRMQEELRNQSAANDREFAKKIVDMKERMRQDLQKQMNIMRSENDVRIAKEMQQREAAMRTRLDKEYESKLTSALVRKEQELRKKKVLLEKRMMDHISKVFS